jgi:hypothetical protein
MPWSRGNYLDGCPPDPEDPRGVGEGLEHATPYLPSRTARRVRRSLRASRRWFPSASESFTATRKRSRRLCRSLLLALRGSLTVTLNLPGRGRASMRPWFGGSRSCRASRLWASVSVTEPRAASLTLMRSLSPRLSTVRSVWRGARFTVARGGLVSGRVVGQPSWVGAGVSGHRSTASATPSPSSIRRIRDPGERQGHAVAG